MKYFLFKFFYCDQTMSPDSGTPVPANLNDFYYFFPKRGNDPPPIFRNYLAFPPQRYEKIPQKIHK